MLKRLCALTAFVLLATGCATERAPRIGYACAARLSNEHGEFEAGPNGVRWTHNLGDGISAFLDLPYAWQSAESFRVDGFGNALDAPGLLITFPRERGANDWRSQPPALSIAGEIRMGAQTHRDWVSQSGIIHAPYSVWRRMLDEAGDMDVILYTSPERTELARGQISRHTLLAIEPTLQRLSARVVEMQADPPRHCEAYEEEEIILTGRLAPLAPRV